MTPKIRRLGPVLALLAGCGEPNPEGPRVPPEAVPKPSADGQPARRPVTKNPREIVNPE
jgi:hypothetical protein